MPQQAATELLRQRVASGVPDEPHQQVVLLRHGETEWSRDLKHTGRTDVPLTDRGRHQAELAGHRLAHWNFGIVLCSPLRRAAETCRIAGCGKEAQIDPDLREWDYGDYDGLTTSQIRQQQPGWLLWRDGARGGEDAADVGVRADRVIARIRELQGHVAVFSHGHFLRVLAARWLTYSPQEGARFALDTACISVLGYEHAVAAILLWNDAGHLGGDRRHD